jgi:hypothetical protein
MPTHELDPKVGNFESNASNFRQGGMHISSRFIDTAGQKTWGYLSERSELLKMAGIGSNRNSTELNRDGRDYRGVEVQGLGTSSTVPRLFLLPRSRGFQARYSHPIAGSAGLQHAGAQQAASIGPLCAVGFLARIKALANLPSTCGAIASTSMPFAARKCRASSIV